MSKNPYKLIFGENPPESISRLSMCCMDSGEG